MTKDAIGIILARGGSKRLPRKNILNFNSKPLIAWSIKAAINSNVFDKVLVSTDDQEIADISKKFGAEVPFLRKSGSDDITPSSEATLIALNEAEEYWNKEFTVVAQLMANCPLRNSKDIKKCFDAFTSSNASSQISCFKFGWMMPWWALKLSEDGRGESIFPEAIKKRSQDLPDLYCPTGAIWFANREELIKNKSFYMKNTRYEEISWISAVDIDEYDDLKMAELCFNLRNH